MHSLQKRGETRTRGEKPTVKTVLVSFQDRGSKVYIKKHKSNIFGVSMEGQSVSSWWEHLCVYFFIFQ